MNSKGNRNKKELEESFRINKFISHNTKYSRREADRLIEEGKVKLNGKVVNDFSLEVFEDDEVYIDGIKVKRRDGLLSVIVYNKPKGELVTKRDDRGRKTIYHSLPQKFSHFIPIGRLDFASEGVLLLTDAPKVADVLLNSSLERIYNIKLSGRLNRRCFEAMEEGIEIIDSKLGAHKNSKIDNITIKPFLAYKILNQSDNFTKIRVAISEGKNRELRRFFAYFGNDVLDLKRVSFGGVELNSLPSGSFRFLERSEYNNLKSFMRDFKTMRLESSENENISI